MDGILQLPYRTTMEKPYLSAPGIDFIGHAVFQKAQKPLFLHTHENCIEIVFVFSGEQRYFTDDSWQDVVGGQTYLSFLGQPHSSGGDYQGIGEIYWFQLNLSCYENFLGYNREFSLEITERLKAIDRHVFRFDNNTRQLAKFTYDKFLHEGVSPIAISSLMQLVNLVIENHKNDNSIENRLLDLNRYIEQHLSENISIYDLSKACGFSVSTVHHRFKEYFGRTPASYINYCKIKAAKEQLLNGQTVTETAMSLGFNSSDYFSTVFKKISGLSPTAWLNEKH